MNAMETPLPTPKLTHDIRVVVDLNPKISVGVGPLGQRNWISFTGGTWKAEWGEGVVVPGGQDSQLVHSDRSARLSTNYLLQTSDPEPAYIVIQTQGWRTGPEEVLKRLEDPEEADRVSPEEYRFRLTVGMETGDPRYGFLNTRMWVGSGMRKGKQVIYDAYRIE